jgi:hypothetical protein
VRSSGACGGMQNEVTPAVQIPQRPGRTSLRVGDRGFGHPPSRRFLSFARRQSCAVSSGLFMLLNSSSLKRKLQRSSITTGRRQPRVEPTRIKPTVPAAVLPTDSVWKSAESLLVLRRRVTADALQLSSGHLLALGTLWHRP